MNETSNFAVEQANTPTGEIVNTNEEKQTEAEIQPKPYTFRRLKPDDIFLVINIVSKIGLKEFKDTLQDDTLGKLIGNLTKKDENESEELNLSTVYTVGGAVLLPMADIVLGNLHKCKGDIYQLLANLTGKTYEEIADLDGVVFFEMVMDFFKKPELADFWKVVSKSFK